MSRLTKQMITVMVAKAEGGVDFGGRGALCPCCGRRAKVVTTRPWESGCRVRYHRCENQGCLLHKLGVTIKSLQQDSIAA